jgi:hypothetical protein
MAADMMRNETPHPAGVRRATSMRQVSSPAIRRVQLKASVVYSNTPVGGGYVFDYLQGTLSPTTRL